MRLVYAKLSGFKGIKRGLGLDALEIDFDKLPQKGLIAFAGQNGCGKTTTLDNIHPFRVAPSRSGNSFYDLCEGEAIRDLVFEHEGKVYRSLILISSDKKKQEAYLYRKDDGGQWAAVNPDGKTTTYDEAIENLLGSEKLFFLSTFRAQNAKPLSAHTKGELKGIFEDLLMLDDIRAKGDRAREVKNHLVSLREKFKRDIDSLSGRMAEQEEKEARKGELKKDIKSLEFQIGAAEKEMKEADASISSLSADIARSEAAFAAIDRLQRDLGRKRQKISALKASLESKRAEFDRKAAEKAKKFERLRKIADNGDIIRQKIAEEKEVLSLLDVLKAEIDRFSAMKDEAAKNLSALEKLATKKAELQKELDAIAAAHKYAVQKTEDELLRARKDAVKLEGVPCAETGMASSCRFVSDAVKARDSLAGLESAVENARLAAEADPKKTLILSGISGIEVRLSERTAVEDALKALGQKLSEVRKEVAAGEARAAETKKNTVLLPELESAEKTLAEIKGEITALENEKADALDSINGEIAALARECESLEAEIEGYKALVDGTLKSKLAEAQSRKTAKDRTIMELRNRANALYAEFGAIEESLKGIAQAVREMEALVGRIGSMDRDITEWALLEKALGKDGIIALEIDDAGPAVSGMANDLLNSCFGSKFAVKIETTRPRKDGSGTMEVFDIRVIDTEQNEEKSLLDLSGGEKVWIEDAVTRAICLYNRQQSGKEVLTVFSDEKDGALDIQKKKEYLLMKRRALELGGCEREFFITHSDELQRLADARVVFEKGVVSYC